MSDIETRQKKLPVLLFIRGEQYFDDVDPDATELTTEGTLELTEKGLLLTYQETALTGMEGTTTTFEVSGPQVILRRVGSVNSQMVFEEGRQHTSLYETPYGELSVDIQTSALRHNLSERGGLLEIKYSIAVEHTVTGRNSFKIRVIVRQRVQVFWRSQNLWRRANSFRPGIPRKGVPRDLSRGKRTVTGRNSFKTRVKREKQELGIRNCGAAAGGNWNLSGFAGHQNSSF